MRDGFGGLNAARLLCWPEAGAGLSEPMVEIHQRATADIGSYFLTLYGGMKGKLLARNAVSAAWRGGGRVRALQARALLCLGRAAKHRALAGGGARRLGKAYYFGDAINACVLEGSEAAPAFWNYVAPIAGDREVAALIDVAEIARHTANTVGGEGFGVPRAEPFRADGIADRGGAAACAETVAAV